MKYDSCVTFCLKFSNPPDTDSRRLRGKDHSGTGCRITVGLDACCLCLAVSEFMMEKMMTGEGRLWRGRVVMEADVVSCIMCTMCRYDGEDDA
ncbi:hypothetical protein QVD17_25416 [Tagetes erecta]|uniref:Uncharacterized protein n=1 Tax=Tagetes erecta TaxID=13708 RepID=A0AAD8KGH5_TARER|nr:hypothetical protein QVD17_25416 [Tagetes erecta]